MPNEEPDQQPDQSKYPAGGLQGEGQAWSIVSYILSGLLFWGGAGWLIDRWLGTSFVLLIGMLVGAAASLYLVWLRYGRQ